MSVVWKLHVTVASGFAGLIPHYKEIPGKRCSKCRALVVTPNPAERSFNVEWECGCSEIGDFMFCRGYVVGMQTVVHDLVGVFRGASEVRGGFAPMPTESKPVKRRTRKNDLIPSIEPELAELYVTHEVELDSQSTVECSTPCDQCGVYYYDKFHGVEICNLKEHVPRDPNGGLFIRAADLMGCDFFRPRYSGLTLCTSRVRDYVMGLGLKNICFLEYGNLI